MARKGQDLLAVLAGSLRPAIKSAAPSGPAIVSADVEDNKYSRAVQKDQEEAARRVAEEARANQPKGTGNEYYDKMPSTVARTKAEEDAAAWDEYAKSQPITQRKSFEETMDENKDFKSWGDALLPERGNREEGKTTGEIIRNGLRDFGEDWAHDTLNNFQLFANNMAHGAESVARFGAKYLDPRSWGSSTKAKLNRQAHDNAAANSRAGYLDKDRRILESMSTGLGANEVAGGKGVSTADKWLARINYATRAGGGQFVGGDLATLGAGTLASGAGKGIQAGSRAVGSRVGQAVASGAGRVGEKVRYARSGFGQTAKNLEAARASEAAMPMAQAATGKANIWASPEAYRRAYANAMTRGNYADKMTWAARAGGRAPTPGGMTAEQHIGNFVNKGVQAVGDAAAGPFNAVARVAGAAHNPWPTIKAVAKPTGQTIAAAGRPVRDLASLIRHPRQMVGSAVDYATAHPFRAAWNAGAYPVRTAWGIARPAASALWKNQMPIYYGSELAAAGSGVASGDMGSAAGAAGRVAGYKLLNRLNPWFNAAPIAYGVYQGATSGNESPYEE